MDMIIKKMTIIGVMAAMLLVTGCGDKNGSESVSGSSSSDAGTESKSASEKVAELAGQIELPSMAEVTAENLHTFLGIDEESVTEFAAQICASGAMPDEFGVFVAADGDAASEIKSTLEERVEKQRETYKDYTPDEMYKFDDCFVTQDGNTVYYAICADNELAADILA